MNEICRMSFKIVNKCFKIYKISMQKYIQVYVVWGNLIILAP